MPQQSYPKSLFEFIQWFPNEEACEKYLYDSRWSDGFICPLCGDKEFYYHKERRLFRCKANDHQTSLTAGTIMHRSRQPLFHWFLAAYLLIAETPGISALQLQRQLGTKRYETIFNLLHKLRSSMVNPFRDKIEGIVEVDETYIGGPSTGGKRGRGTQKAIVIVAVERRGTKAGRIRLRYISNLSEETIMRFIDDSIEKKTIIITDSLKSYWNLSKHGYTHKAITQKRANKESSLPIAHIAISNLKTWLKGTHHGVSKKHLQAYLNEFVFRFNRRFYPMAGFRTILQLASKVEFPTYKGLYEGTWQHPNPARKRQAKG